MLYMNEWEATEARRRIDPAETPNLAQAADTLCRLIEWTNDNSDGWAYWPKPCRAAKTLQTLLTEADGYDPVDVTRAQLTAAYRPIKAFLTRHGADHASIFRRR